MFPPITTSGVFNLLIASELTGVIYVARPPTIRTLIIPCEILRGDSRPTKTHVKILALLNVVKT